MTKTVDVTTDSATSPKLTLTMKGRIDVLVGFEKPFLDFGRIPEGTVRTEKVRIEAMKPGSLHLSGLKVSDPLLLKAELVKDGGSDAIAVTLTAGPIPAQVSGRVTVATGVPEAPELTLQVRAKVGGDLDVMPPTAVLSPFEKGLPFPEITMRVSSASGKPFSLLKVEDPAGALAGTVAPQGQGWLVRIVLRKAPKTSSGLVYVLTDRKDQPRMAIPYLVSDPAASIAKMGKPKGIAPSPAPARPAVTPPRH